MIGHDGNTIGETACLRLIPERNVAWALMMNLAGQNWAAMELAQELIDPWLGTVTPGRPEPTSLPISEADAAGRRVPEHRLPADGELPTATGLLLDIESTAGSDGDREPGPAPPRRRSGFVLRLARSATTCQLTFMERAGDGRYEYLHLGARLHRRRR